MTYSDCWIDTVDDDEFRAFKAQQTATDGEPGASAGSMLCRGRLA